MFETAGVLRIVEGSGALVWLALLPMLAAVVVSLLRLTKLGVGAAARLALLPLVATFVLAMTLAIRVIGKSDRRALVQPLFGSGRVGHLDVSLGLSMGDAAATCAVLASVLGLAFVLSAAASDKPDASPNVGWLSLAEAGSLVVVLSDGFPTMFVGIGMLTVAAWGLGHAFAHRWLGVALAADVAVVFGAWLLFWSLGGSFGTAGYEPDMQPRLLIVTDTGDVSTESKATIQMTTYEGALVMSDDGSPLPGEPLRAPFASALAPGVYSFRVQAGPTTPELLVGRVTLEAGRTYTLTPYGPTTNFRNLADQIKVPRAKVATPASTTPWAARRVVGLTVTTWLAILFGFGIFARLAWLSTVEDRGASLALGGASSFVLALHVAPLFELGESSSTFAFIGVAVALIAAAAAASERVPARALKRAFVASFAIAGVTIMLGDGAAALVILVSGTLAFAAAMLVVESGGDVRVLGIASAGWAGALPGAGVSAGLAAAFATSLHRAELSAREAPLFLLLFVACALTSLSSLRVYGTHIGRPLPGGRGDLATRVVAATLATSGIVLGTVLGIGSSPFGGRAVPLVRRLVQSAAPVDASPKLAVFGWALAVGATLLGWLLARRATDSAELPTWLSKLALPLHVLGRACDRTANVTRFLGRSVLAMDHHVVDDVGNALSQGALQLSARLRRSEQTVERGARERVMEAGAAQFLVKTGLDDPRRADRVRTALLIAMVALLAAVVLSSVLLG